MIGDKWKSEIREFKDAKTGRTFKQLTTTGNNVHLYFTENSFDSQRNEIIFRSDRASNQDRKPHDQFLDDQPGFHRFAQAHIIGN